MNKNDFPSDIRQTSDPAKTDPFTSSPTQAPHAISSDMFPTHGIETGIPAEEDVGNLLGDFTSFSSFPESNKDKGSNSAAGGDTQVNFTDPTHEYDYAKAFPMSSARLDQVSPPRSPFEEIDKSSLSDDHFGMKNTNMSPLAPAPPAEIFSTKDEFAIFNTVPSTNQTVAPPNPPNFDVMLQQFELPEDMDGGFMEIKPFPSALTTLDEIQPPDFYESGGDSSISKDGGRKSATDSQVLEPDDLDHYLPRDPIEPLPRDTESFPREPESLPRDLIETLPSDPTESKGPEPATVDNQPFESHTAATNMLEEEAVTEFTSSFLTSADKHIKESKDAANSGTKTFLDDEETEGKVSPYNFYTKEPMFIPEESIPFDQIVEPSSPTEDSTYDPYEFDDDKNTVPLSPTTKMDEDHLVQLEPKHAELSTFLQERDPSMLDEYDRSEDSISPNPQIVKSAIPVDSNLNDNFDNGELMLDEPLMSAVRIGSTESRAFPTNQGPFYRVEDKDSPDSVDDYEFEVIPPKVPPHKYPLEEPKTPGRLESFGDYEPQETKNEGVRSSHSQDLYQVGEPIGLCPTPPPSASEIEKKALVAEAQKTADEEELIPFLPKESFETIAPVYQAPPEEIVPNVIAPSAPVESTKKDDTPTKIIRKRSAGSDAEISNEAQQILNIFYPID